MLIDGDLGPLSEKNQEALGRMVREGYEKWREFDERYSEQQKLIRNQDAGLMTWNDLQSFSLNYCKAESQSDYFTERFKLEGSDTVAQQRGTPVVKLVDGSLVACEDLGGLPAYGPNGTVATQCGVNHPGIVDTLRGLAFPEEDVGPAFLRWPRSIESGLEMDCQVAVLVLFKETFRTDDVRGWMEQSSELRFFQVSSTGAANEISEAAVRAFITGLPEATVRSKMPVNAGLVNRLASIELAYANS